MHTEITRMIWNFEYLIVFTRAPGVLPEQYERYWIQPWKVNDIKANKKTWVFYRSSGKEWTNAASQFVSIFRQNIKNIIKGLQMGH